MKKVLAVLLTVLLVFGLCSCAKSDETVYGGGEVNGEKIEDENLPVSQGFKATHNVVIKVKDVGEIKLELYGEEAPITVNNFVSLVNKKFYDGLTFHRIIEGFMIQGGDPEGNGTGGSDKEIKGEFSANGVENPISHKRGVLSMARANDPNSASSQFFIMHEDYTGLDGSYAAFGMVTSGIGVVDKLAEDTPVVDNNGTVQNGKQPIIEYIKIVE